MEKVGIRCIACSGQGLIRNRGEDRVFSFSFVLYIFLPLKHENLRYTYSVCSDK